MTTDILMKKIEHIEELLMALNGKIDNFLGFEDMAEEEREEVDQIRKEIQAGEYYTFDDVFEDWGMYELIYSKQSRKFIRSLQKGYRDKLKDIMVQLRENPFSYPYKKIRGDVNTYRIRVGRYRILYEIDQNSKRIAILKIEFRGKVYK